MYQLSLTLLLNASRSSKVSVSDLAITGIMFTHLSSLFINSKSSGFNLLKTNRKKYCTSFHAKKPFSNKIYPLILSYFEELSVLKYCTTLPVTSWCNEVKTTMYSGIRNSCFSICTGFFSIIMCKLVMYVVYYRFPAEKKKQKNIHAKHWKCK